MVRALAYQVQGSKSFPALKKQTNTAKQTEQSQTTNLLLPLDPKDSAFTRACAVRRFSVMLRKRLTGLLLMMQNS